jgi:hypothetical protein
MRLFLQGFSEVKAKKIIVRPLFLVRLTVSG